MGFQTLGASGSVMKQFVRESCKMGW